MRKKIIRIAVAAVVVGLIAAGVIAIKSRVDYDTRFTDEHSIYYFNKSVIDERRIALVEKQFNEEGFEVGWDENGYLLLGQWNALGDIWETTSYSKHWQKFIKERGLTPPPSVFESVEGACEYIRNSKLYVTEHLVRYYTYLWWTQEQAETYTEFAKKLGYTENQEHSSVFGREDYIYIAKNAAGESIIIQYRRLEDGTDSGYVMVEYKNSNGAGTDTHTHTEDHDNA